MTILTNVTDASDAKFRVCDPSRLSRSRRFQRWRVFAFRVVKMLSRRGREDAKTRTRSRLPSSDDTQGLGECDWGQMAQSDIFILVNRVIYTRGAH